MDDLCVDLDVYKDSFYQSPQKDGYDILADKVHSTSVGVLFRTEASVEGKVSVSWGGATPLFDASLHGRVSNDKGHGLKMDFERNSETGNKSALGYQYQNNGNQIGVRFENDGEGLNTLSAYGKYDLNVDRDVESNDREIHSSEAQYDPDDR